MLYFLFGTYLIKQDKLSTSFVVTSTLLFSNNGRIEFDVDQNWGFDFQNVRFTYKRDINGKTQLQRQTGLNYLVIFLAHIKGKYLCTMLFVHGCDSFTDE